MKHNQLPLPAHKRRVRITESDLCNIVKRIIRESRYNRSECREVFSVHGFDEETGEQLYDKRVYVDYYDLDKAVEAADELAKDYADYPGVNIYVMAGSCETPDGDVYGDEDAIYCAKKADTLNESIRRAIRRYLR